jgi:hypothetical protein
VSTTKEGIELPSTQLRIKLFASSMEAITIEDGFNELY